MGKRYSQSEISGQLRKTYTVADLVKTIHFLVRIYKIGMLQCAQLGFCPEEGMNWSIASYMINMPYPTCNRLWNQICGLFRRGMYSNKSHHHKCIMKDWRDELDSKHALKQKIVYHAATNDHIKSCFTEAHSTPYKLTKYKNYDAFFLKHHYADSFQSRRTKATQITLESDEIDNFLNPYKSYFTDCVFSRKDDDASVVDEIPARNQSVIEDITDEVLPGDYYDFDSVQSSSSEDSSSSDEINEETDNLDSDLCIINPVNILHEGDSNHSVIDNVEVAPFVSRKKSLIYNSHNINGKFFKIHWNIFFKHNVNNCVFFSLRQR